MVSSMHWLRPLLLCIGIATASAAAAQPIDVRIGAITYTVDPATVEIDATTGGIPLAVMPPLHSAQAVTVTAQPEGWHWRDTDGHTFHLSTENDALHLTIFAAAGTNLSWNFPKPATGTWLVPDGEGMAYNADDPFWRADFHAERCMGGLTSLSFPAWSYLNANSAVTYALGDGLLSAFCMHDQDGLQARLTHDFGDGAQTLDLLFAIRPPEPLAPALFYRAVLKARGQFKSFADKMVPDLPRLFGAPHAYVWGTGHDLAFLDDLKALGIERMVLTYSADAQTPEAALRPFFTKAYALGYLSGPYEAFDNGQPAATADSPEARWDDDLYPSGCIHDTAGKAMHGFGNRGCEMSSEAIARRTPYVPAVRYARHIANGASEVFIDVDGFGEFREDASPDHPMTKARDRQNRLARMGTALHDFHLVVGSEKVGAWATPVTHFSHGTGQTHFSTVWHLLGSKRFGGWWPPGRPTLFFQPYQPTPDEARDLFAPADRLPLFEGVFHDSVVAVDRWEFGLMKVAGQERNRFARALLYGTPTMWNLDRRELARTGTWLKAAHDDFLAIHGIAMPVALTGFEWLTPDRLVQQARYADGRVTVANFGAEPWQGLASDCVRASWPDGRTATFCPPPDPPPYRP